MVDFSLLLSGPRMSMDLPEGFHPQPSIRGVIGRGDRHDTGREFTFNPQWLDDTDGLRNYVREDDRIAPEGQVVEVYRRDDPPQQWFLRWRCATGSLYSHVREEDGREAIDEMVRHVRVVDDEEAVILLPEGPFRRFVARRPGFSEDAMFFGLEPDEGGSGGLLRVQRPGLLPPGRSSHVQARGGDDVSVARRGSRHGVDLLLEGTWSQGRSEEMLEECERSVQT